MLLTTSPSRGRSEREQAQKGSTKRYREKHLVKFTLTNVRASCFIIFHCTFPIFNTVLKFMMLRHINQKYNLFVG